MRSGSTCLSLAGVSPDEAVRLTTAEGASKAARTVPNRMPVGIDLRGRWVFVYVVAGDQLDDLHSFLQQHAGALSALPAWTLRIVFPPHLAWLGERYQEHARHELASPCPDL